MLQAKRVSPATRSNQNHEQANAVSKGVGSNFILPRPVALLERY